jgi:hypothetical protein
MKLQLFSAEAVKDRQQVMQIKRIQEAVQRLEAFHADGKYKMAADEAAFIAQIAQAYTEAAR